MRVVTWNCGGALRRKYPALESLKADILVIQECENPATSRDQTYKKWAANHLWIGSGHKGIGVFARPNLPLKPVDVDDLGLQLLLPCRIGNLFLLAVWTKKSNSSTYRYIGQLWQWLQAHQRLLAADKALLLGDFNSNAIWDAQHRGCSHSDVVQILERHNFASLYHHTTGERHGQERTPTLFFQRKLAKPYHIDYAFLSKALLCGARIEVGHPESWLALSDHMPILIEATL